MYGNRKTATPAPQPGQKPQPQSKGNKPMGNYWPRHCPGWYDYNNYDDTDYYYDYYTDYDNWYDWVWTSAYSKGLGEGRQQGFSHAVKLAESAMDNIAPTEHATTPVTDEMTPGNVGPMTTTTLGI